MAESPSSGIEAADAARWWQAYQLAEHDQDDELRRLAAAGDDHARRHLASWLADRAFRMKPDGARLSEAIEAIRPLADSGDDVAELWLTRWLVDCDRISELRERADGGSYHAGRELPSALADHGLLDELRARAGRGDQNANQALIETLADRDMHEELRERLDDADADARQLIFDSLGSPAGMNAMRVLADLGHKSSQMALARRLFREGRLEELRQRADAGDDYARHWLDEMHSQP